MFRAFNLYLPQHLPPSDEFRGIIGASSLGIVLLVVASYWSKAAFPRVWLGLAWLLASSWSSGHAAGGRPIACG